MLQHLNDVDASCESIHLLKRKADILSTSYDISIHKSRSSILVNVC